MFHEYGAGSSSSSAAEALEGYISTGNSGAVLSGRVAYALGLQGPAMTVDTACSSSLVALHLACQSLRSGECSLALAGGVTVLAAPALFVDFARQRGLAPDGRCKSFADAADGAGFSEGVGLLALERLSDAQRLGHPVLALVRGSAVNQDGASNGLTAPNGPSQQRVIAQALANAGLAPADVDVVEAHGTGTTLGDPIEAQALLATYGHGRPAERPLLLGSVKSNLGHTQAAAGVAGVIKTVLSMRHGLLPRTLHVDEPSRQVDWSAGAVELLREAVPWEGGGDRLRRAGVSSFGISGTNAHVILEEAPAAPAISPSARIAGGPLAAVGAAPEEGPGGILGPDVVPWVLSGRGGEAGLRAQALRLAEFAGARPELDPHDVAVSLTARSAFERRAVVVGAGRDELLEGLNALAAGQSAPGVVEGLADLGGGGVAFIFPGQGGQWAGMAVELLDASPVFAAALRECGDALAEFAEWSLEDVLRGANDAPGLDGVDVVQPALFAVMVALARLWQACGVRPSVVVGHSQGEIAAAHVAGGLSLRDAARLVVVRSRLLVGLMGRGGMVSVALSEGELAPRLERWDGAIGVAAVNGPGSVVVSGERQALDELLAELVDGGVRAREIPVGYASHSAQIEEIREELLEGCAGIEPVSGSVPFLSTVTGETMDTADLDADYWFRNLREPVHFAGAVRRLLDDGCRAFVEVSPHPVLTIGVQETVDQIQDGHALIAGSLRRDEGGPRRFLLSLAQAWSAGAPVEWGAVCERASAARVPLPTYAFQRERYWLAPGTGAGDVSSAGLVAAAHPLLSAMVPLADGEAWLFTGRLALDSHPWLADHAVMGSVLLPGAALLELALRAGREVGCPRVGELVLEAPLVLDESGAAHLQISVGAPDEQGQRSLSIHSRPQSAIEAEGGHGWTRHAAGVLQPAGGSVDVGIPAGAWPPAGAQPVGLDGLYDRLSEWGLEYGPTFRGLTEVWQQGEELFAEVALPEGGGQAERFGIHPALLDAALHTLGLGIVGEGLETKDGGVLLPFAWSGVELSAEGAGALRVRIAASQAGGISLLAADELGAPVLAVESLLARPISAEQLAGAAGAPRDSLLHVEWVASEAAPEAGEAHEVYADPAALSAAMAGWVAAPDVVAVELGADAGDPVERALELMQAWLADERVAAARLVLVTHGAVAVGEGDGVPGLDAAGVWGLVRSAQSENPGRFTLVDVDEHEASVEALAGAIAMDEPQLAVRAGVVLAPRLARMAPAAAPDTGAASDPEAAAPGMGEAVLDPEGTVLITGGTGGLGALVARHMVVAHGARHLLLTSRRGSEAPGADELADELTGLGARVRVEACDVGDRDALAALIESIGAEHPLRGVVHAAGALDDGTISTLTPERVAAVLAGKAGGARNLHELTQDMELSLFVLFSSVAGVLGGPGQGNYAAANAYLDALAAHRRAQGLAGTSIAWGQWAQDASTSAMTAALGAGDLARLARAGVLTLSAEQGLALLDDALAAPQALLVGARWDAAALRAQARAGALPGMLRGLVRMPARRAGAGGSGSLAARLAALEGEERRRAVLELVCGEAATVLGHSSAGAVDPRLAFKDLGFDSLMAVELRNRLAAVTGLRCRRRWCSTTPRPRRWRASCSTS